MSIAAISIGQMGFIAGCGKEVKIVEVRPENVKFTQTNHSEKLNARALDISGNEIQGIPFTYSSENPQVADVDMNGNVTPRGNGSTAVIAHAPSGVTGETFVKVCLLKEIKCDQSSLDLHIDTSTKLHCKLLDCKDAEVPTTMEIKVQDTNLVLKDGEDLFIGTEMGDTNVIVKAMNLEKTIPVHVGDRLTPKPGGGGKGGGGGGGGKKEDPYESGGDRFNHILKNMQFSGN